MGFGYVTGATEGAFAVQKGSPSLYFILSFTLQGSLIVKARNLGTNFRQADFRFTNIIFEGIQVGCAIVLEMFIPYQHNCY